MKKAIHRKTGRIAALKFISKNCMRSFNCLEQVKSEIEIHCRLQHPNIIECYGYYKDSDNIVIILEYANGGCLYNHKLARNYLTEEETSRYIAELISALRYLHSYRIIHRDIKPENILLHDGHIKLCDFGCSTKLEHNSFKVSLVGTLEYMSLELCNSQEYDEKIDIWSIGVLAYELLTGDVPFKAATPNEMATKVIDMKVENLHHPQISEDAFAFISSILVINSKRPSLESLLKTSFIVKYNR